MSKLKVAIIGSGNWQGLRAGVVYYIALLTIKYIGDQPLLRWSARMCKSTLPRSRNLSECGYSKNKSMVET